MATTLNLPYIRFVRQVTTGPGSNPQFVAMMEEGLAALKVAAWKQADAELATIAMPSNDPLNFVPNDKYDAYKASKTTAAAGTQTCNLGMAAYRYKIPADAISGSHYVQSVVATIGADKFAYSGVKVALILSDATTPPTDWTLLRTGGLATTPDATRKFATYDANPEVYGVLDSRDQASVSNATNKAEAFTFDLSAVAGNYAYLYVVVSMYDYTDYRANRPYWIEGSSIVNGDSLAVTIEGTVTADASTVFDGWRYMEAVAMSRDVAGAATYTAHNYAITSDGSSHTSENQLMANFPLLSVRGSAVNGDTGFVVGVDTSNVVTGGYAVRYIHTGENDKFTKFKFGNAAVLPLSGKTVKMRLNIWAGTTLSSLYPNVTTYESPKIANVPTVGGPAAVRVYTGIYQTALFNNSGSVSVETFIPGVNTGVPVTATTSLEMGTWTLTNVGQFDLFGKDYTNSDVFTLAPITGPGIKVIMVTIRPLAYWGTIGTNTKATWKPGEIWTIA